MTRTMTGRHRGQASFNGRRAYASMFEEDKVGSRCFDYIIYNSSSHAPSIHFYKASCFVLPSFQTTVLDIMNVARCERYFPERCTDFGSRRSRTNMTFCVQSNSRRICPAPPAVECHRYLNSKVTVKYERPSARYGLITSQTT